MTPEEYLKNLGLDNIQIKHPKSGSDTDLIKLLSKYIELETKDFQDVSNIAIKYMNESHHPHCTMIVMHDRCEVLEGIKAHVTDEYIKD